MKSPKRKPAAKPKPRSRKPVGKAFLKEFAALARSHGHEGLMIAQVTSAAAAPKMVASLAPICPDGQKLTRVTFKDEFGNTINRDICL